MLQFQQRNVKF